MEKALRIFSIITIILGGLAILGAAEQSNPTDFYYSFVGGLFFLVEGIMALVYIGQQHPEVKA